MKDCTNKNPIQNSNVLISEQYLKFTDLFFLNKKENFSLMKNMMYVIGSIVSAFYYMSLHINNTSDNEMFILVCILVHLIEFVIFIFSYQINDLIVDNKFMLKKLFDIEKMMGKKNNFFDAFDSDFEFFGSFFVLITSFFSILIAGFFLYLTLYNLFLNNINEFLFCAIIISQFLFILSAVKVLKSVIYSDFNQIRISYFWMNGDIKLIYFKYYYYLYINNFIIKYRVKFLKTILVLMSINKSNRKLILEASNKILKIKMQYKELLKETNAEIISISKDFLNKNKKKINQYKKSIVKKRFIKDLAIQNVRICESQLALIGLIEKCSNIYWRPFISYSCVRKIRSLAKIKL